MLHLGPKHILLFIVSTSSIVLCLPVDSNQDTSFIYEPEIRNAHLSTERTSNSMTALQLLIRRGEKETSKAEHLRPISVALKEIGVADPVQMAEALPLQVPWGPAIDPVASSITTDTNTTALMPEPNPTDPQNTSQSINHTPKLGIIAIVVGCFACLALAGVLCRSLIVSTFRAVVGKEEEEGKGESGAHVRFEDAKAGRDNEKALPVDDSDDMPLITRHVPEQNLPPFTFPSLSYNIESQPSNILPPSQVINPPKIVRSEPTPALDPVTTTMQSHIPRYVGHLLPSTPFQCSTYGKDSADRTIATAATRTSFLTHSASCHSRTLSAPISNQTRPFSVATTTASSESEWDIAKAYGGPRFDKTKSAGAMSGVSFESEWSGKGV